MTSLEAFDEIIKCCNEYHHWFTVVDIETIEGYPIENIRKSLQALEIIKNKKINLEYLKCCENYEQYKTVCSYWNEITKKEYNLLKEVLL